MIPLLPRDLGRAASRTKPRRLSTPARAILRVLRREWEMATADLRDESGVKDRAAFTRALDELQAAMLVVPSEVFYQPKFTYIWTLGVGRFPDALAPARQPRRRAPRDRALLPDGRGHDDPRRAGARDGPLAPGRRPRQPRARRRRIRDDARAGVGISCVHAEAPGPRDAGGYGSGACGRISTTVNRSAGIDPSANGSGPKMSE